MLAASIAPYTKLEHRVSCKTLIQSRVHDTVLKTPLRSIDHPHSFATVTEAQSPKEFAVIDTVHNEAPGAVSKGQSFGWTFERRA